MWTVGADGSDPTPLALVPRAHGIDWHPDGKTLLVSTFGFEDGRLYVGVDEIDGVTDAEVHGGGERVAALGAVDDHVGENAVALEPQVRRAQPVTLGRPGLGRPRLVGSGGRVLDSPPLVRVRHVASSSLNSRSQ